MLKQIRKPKSVELHRSDQPVIIAKGWKVTNFTDEDGNTYERAEKDGVIKWFVDVGLQWS